MTPKSKKSKSQETKKAYKNKVICHNKQSPKNFSDPISTPKLARQHPKKTKNDLQKQKEIKNQKTKIFTNESYQFTKVNPKNFSDPYPDQKKYLDRAPKG